MNLVWCLTLEEVHDNILQEAMLANMWAKADHNCKKAPKTNLNKMLEVKNQQLDDDDRHIYTIRKLTYLFEMYDKTAFKWTQDQFEEKVKKAYKRWYRIRFQHIQLG